MLQVVSAQLSTILIFGVLFASAIVMFGAALSRQTILTNLFSSILWFGLSYVVLGFGDPTSGLTQGASYVFLALGLVMFLSTFYQVFNSLRAAAEEKQRQIAEDVV